MAESWHAASLNYPPNHTVVGMRGHASQLCVMLAAPVALDGAQAAMRDVRVPRSIPRLTTTRVLTMEFLPGDPITRLKVGGPCPACAACFGICSRSNIYYHTALETVQVPESHTWTFSTSMHACMQACSSLVPRRRAAPLCSEAELCKRTHVQERGESMPVSVRQLFARRLLGRVAEAYGRMLLLSGLFQADCHPGNILVSDNGKLGMLAPTVHIAIIASLLPCMPHVRRQRDCIRTGAVHARAGLIDFGQSKQLTQPERLAFARLVLALSEAKSADLLRVVEALSLEQQLAVSQGLDEIGVRLGPGTLGLRVRMAFGMFDTRGRCDSAPSMRICLAGCSA